MRKSVSLNHKNVALAHSSFETAYYFTEIDIEETKLKTSKIAIFSDCSISSSSLSTIRFLTKVSSAWTGSRIPHQITDCLCCRRFQGMLHMSRYYQDGVCSAPWVRSSEAADWASSRSCPRIRASVESKSIELERVGKMSLVKWRCNILYRSRVFTKFRLKNLFVLLASTVSWGMRTWR